MMKKSVGNKPQKIFINLDKIYEKLRKGYSIGEKIDLSNLLNSAIFVDGKKPQMFGSSQTGSYNNAAFDEKNKKILATKDDVIELWNFNGEQAEKIFVDNNKQKGSKYGKIISLPDEQFAVVYTINFGKRYIQLRDAKTGDCLKEWVAGNSDNGSIIHLSYQPGDKTLASCNKAGISYWNMDGTLKLSIKLTGEVLSIDSFKDTLACIVEENKKKKLCIFQYSQMKWKINLPESTSLVHFTPQGDLLLGDDKKGTVDLINLKNINNILDGEPKAKQQSVHQTRGEQKRYFDGAVFFNGSIISNYQQRGDYCKEILIDQGALSQKKLTISEKISGAVFHPFIDEKSKSIKLLIFAKQGFFIYTVAKFIEESNTKEILKTVLEELGKAKKSNVKEIDLSNNKCIDDSFFDSIVDVISNKKNLQELETINLENTALTSEIIETLKEWLTLTNQKVLENISSNKEKNSFKETTIKSNPLVQVNKQPPKSNLQQNSLFNNKEAKEKSPPFLSMNTTERCEKIYNMLEIEDLCKVLEKNNLLNNFEKQCPSHICSLSLEIMKNPALLVATDKKTNKTMLAVYERENIEECLKSKKIIPESNIEICDNYQLLEDKHTKQLIKENMISYIILHEDLQNKKPYDLKTCLEENRLKKLKILDFFEVPKKKSELSEGELDSQQPLGLSLGKDVNPGDVD